MNINLTDLSQQATFKIGVEFRVNEEPVEFTFGNSTKSFERVNLIIADEQSQTVEPLEIQMLLPLKREKVKQLITIDNPFLYNIIGSINNADNKILLDLGPIKYELSKRKKYFIYVKFRGTTSNKLLIHF